MKNTDSKNILLSVLGIAILLVAVVGISYAIFVYTSASNVENKLSTGTISMKYTESDTNVISIQNAIPISDIAGMNQTDYFDFMVSSAISGNATINYEIRAIKIDVSPLLPIADSDIKMYLEKKIGDKYVQVLSPKEFTLSDTTNLSNVEVDSSMLLYTGEFSNYNSDTKNSSENFRLRMWLDEDSVIDEIARTFKVKVNVYASVIN